MTWFDIRYSGVTYVENFTGADEKVLVGLGFHGYATQLEAQAHPNNANFVQMTVASNILAGHPAIGPGNAVSNIANAAGSAASNASELANPLGDIGDFFHRLTEASTWIRVGEVAAGLLLLYIGLKAVVTPGGVPVASQSAKKTITRIAKKTPAGFAAGRRVYRKARKRPVQTAGPKKATKPAPAPRSKSAPKPKATPKPEAAKPSQTEIRRMLRARADQISTRVPPPE